MALTHCAWSPPLRDIGPHAGDIRICRAVRMCELPGGARRTPGGPVLGAEIPFCQAIGLASVCPIGARSTEKRWHGGSAVIHWTTQRALAPRSKPGSPPDGVTSQARAFLQPHNDGYERFGPPQPVAAGLLAPGHSVTYPQHRVVGWRHMPIGELAEG